MKAKHTPGPWTASRMLLTKRAKDRRSGFIVNGPDSTPLPARICDIRCSPQCAFTEAEANARLISAAPDLLAALQALEKIGTAGIVARHETGKPTWNALDAIAGIAGAAIAKAKEGA